MPSYSEQLREAVKTVGRDDLAEMCVKIARQVEHLERMVERLQQHVERLMLLIPAGIEIPAPPSPDNTIH